MPQPKVNKKPKIHIEPTEPDKKKTTKRKRYKNDTFNEVLKKNKGIKFQNVYKWDDLPAPKPKTKSSRDYIPTGYKVGRPTKYHPGMCDYMVKFFMKQAPLVVKDKYYHKPDHRLAWTDMIVDPEDNDIKWPLKSEHNKVIWAILPTFQRYCVEIGIIRDTFFDWIKKYAEFSDTYNYCRELQHSIILENTASGLYQANFAMFLLKNDYHYVDRIENVIKDWGEDDTKKPDELTEDQLKKKLAAIREKKKQLENSGK